MKISCRACFPFNGFLNLCSIVIHTFLFYGFLSFRFDVEIFPIRLLQNSSRSCVGKGYELVYTKQVDRWIRSLTLSVPHTANRQQSTLNNNLVKNGDNFVCCKGLKNDNTLWITSRRNRLFEPVQ